jgi:hypothetical protein
MKKLALIGLLAMPIAACASVEPAPVQRSVGKSHDLGVRATAPVGATIFSEYDYVATGGATMLQPVSESVGLGGSVTVQPGAQLVAASVDGEPGFCTTTPSYSDPLAGATRATCYYDEDGDQHFETMWVAPGTVGFTYGLDPPVPYRASPMTGAQGFKYELVYSGIDGNTLRIGYREYADNLARPAFAQDLTYPIHSTGPTMIRFQAVQIEVIEANASEITYRVLSGFGRSARRHQGGAGLRFAPDFSGLKT